MNDLINALIVVDVQKDFVEGGAVPVQGGTKVAQAIHDFVQKHIDDYRVIAASRCWHPNRPDFEHFKEWGVHCPAFMDGARFVPELNAYDPFQPLFDGPNPDGTLNFVATPLPDVEPQPDQIVFDQIFYKGQDSAAYSAFEGVRVGSGLTLNDNTLKQYLDDRKVRHLDIVGIATDHCVLATGLDGLRNGYDTTVLTDLCAGVTPETTEAALVEMRKKGIHVETAYA